MSRGPAAFSKRTIRRFVLGRQGLWPGRRWSGVEGTAQAIDACEAVQLDPLAVVARAHDIALWSRVHDYRPEHLEQVMYAERRFFEYGGALYVYPMHELPYWRVQMSRWAQNTRWSKLLSEKPETAEAVRAALRERGPLGNRDLDGGERVHSYRGRKDTAVALYALWITGEVMVHHRRRFERVYDFHSNIAPPEHNRRATEAEAAEHFGRKIAAHSGLVRLRPWIAGVADALNRRVDLQADRAWVQRLIESGAAAEIRVEGEREPHHVLGPDLAALEALEAGELPGGWEPTGAATTEEVVFLSPLDIVSARGRAKKLFDFDYIWEVYKPKAQRRWGYYTLPVLYGDRLVARLDPRLERGRQTLQLEGFWLEDGFDADADFAAALAAGLLRFARFLEAEAVNLGTIRPRELRRAAAQALAGSLTVIE